MNIYKETPDQLLFYCYKRIGGDHICGLHQFFYQYTNVKNDIIGISTNVLYIVINSRYTSDTR